MSNARFEGKTALITGGAGAIGAAAARRFAAEGARIAVVDLDADRTAAIVAELEDSGAEALGIVADTASEEDAVRAVAETVTRFGRLDILFNNAGIAGTVAPVYALDVADWDEIVRINLRGIFLIQREALKAMIASKIAGSIVNMSSSMAGFDVLSGASGYAATKHAVLGLTRIAALDVARYGIRVNAVCPGVIETHLGVPATDDEGYRSGTEHFANRIPLRRIGQTEDVAAVVAFLASGDAAHVTGVGWLIDGGQTMQSWSNAPSGDRYPLG
ncbi:MAG: SDR family oxidoreductase [Bauldia sp.]|uniref:SDR family NAD(P)-dependent oxidoreductase n=1 Tax=Bauldia sp. TaxID=2575872 RepID=UPI001D4D6153|nr:SDR family NAD(P)-dependent oxidoreductase [Bauldia sp.]MCB1494741.1 SDR family oxidoreductase [Bauldia sp.]